MKLNVLGFGAFFLAFMVAGMPVAKPERVVVNVRPLTQFSCSLQEHIEYHGACAHRERMDGILRAVKQPDKRKG